MIREDAERLAAILSAAFSMREDAAALYTSRFEQVIEVAPLEQAIMESVDKRTDPRPPTIGRLLERAAEISSSYRHEPDPVRMLPVDSINWGWRRREIARLRALAREAPEGGIGGDVAGAL